MNKITQFEHKDQQLSVEFVETSTVKEGVRCDVYRIPSDDTKDLGIIEIQPGFTSPRQRILKGTRTIQRYMSGTAHLVVSDKTGAEKIYEFKSGDPANFDVEVALGEIMQWFSLGPEPLVYYEICEPPFEEGRFENLPD